jgi:iron(III) transport system substrate-binding protein
MKRLPLLALALVLAGACTKSAPQKEVWIYASYYREILALFEPGLKKAFPDVKIQWFQSGSENVAAKLQAELAGGRPQADLLITSDLFSYMEFQKQGAFATITAPNLAKLPEGHVTADKTIAVVRYPVMVLAWNKKIPEADRPKSLKDLLSPKYKGKLTMPSPLESGTALTTIMYMKQLYGTDYFKGLRANDILAAGGNGAAMSRLQSGERPVGLVLIENVLQAMEKGNSSVEFAMPSEGAIVVPSPMAILKTTKDLELSQRIYDWFLGEEAQKILVKGWIYSALPGSPAPNNAPAWGSFKALPWSLETFSAWSTERQDVKTAFQNTVLK